MNAYRETRHYTSIINNNIYFIKVEIFYYSESITHNLEVLDLINNPTYILETNNNYYEYYSTPPPNYIPREINGEGIIALYLRNNNDT